MLKREDLPFCTRCSVRGEEKNSILAAKSFCIDSALKFGLVLNGQAAKGQTVFFSKSDKEVDATWGL